MMIDLAKCWILRREPTEEGGLPSYMASAKGCNIAMLNYSIDKWQATRFTEGFKNSAPTLPGEVWEKLDLKNEVTLDDLRHRLLDRPMWSHGLVVIGIIEKKASEDTYYAADVEQWLTDPTCSTIWLRDQVMAPLRYDPRLVEIGKQFNPTTEWYNTWMPLDTTIHCVRNGMKIGE